MAQDHNSSAMSHVRHNLPTLSSLKYNIMLATYKYWALGSVLHLVHVLYEPYWTVAHMNYETSSTYEVAHAYSTLL